MRNFYSLLIFICLILLQRNNINAQTPTYFNNNTASPSNAFPWGTTAGKGIQNYFPANTFPSSFPGFITKIYYKVTPNITSTYTQLTIKLAQTSNASLATGGISTFPFTTVYYMPSVTLTSNSSGWLEITLQTPFLYDPSQALISDVFNCSSSSSSMSTANFTPGPSPTRTYTNNTSCSPVYSGQDAITAAFGFDLIPAGPCTNPPTAGTTVVNNTALCAGNTLNLNLSGNSYGTGQTYQWQSSTTATGPWTNVGAPLTLTPFQTTTATSTLYYRCAVTCGTGTSYSNAVQVSVPPLFPGGTYTINRNQPTAGTNFASFNEAFQAIKCGITGPIIFNVVPGSGPYNEHVVVPEVSNASSVNTITVNGNNNQILASPTSTDPGAISLKGIDYLTINDLRVFANAGTMRYALWATNASENVTIRGCEFLVDSNSTTSSYNGVVITGGPTYTTANSGCHNFVFENNRVVGGYTTFSIYGNALNSQLQGVVIRNNTFKDFYYYGIYTNGLNGPIIENNDLLRPDRTSFTTTYAMNINSGTYSAKIIGNRIHNMFDKAPTNTSALYPLYFYHYNATTPASDPNIIANNAVYNVNNMGTFYGLYIYYGKNTKVYHNTVILDQPAGVTTSSSSTVYGLYNYGSGTGASSSENVDFKNNLVSITRNHTNNIHGFYVSAVTLPWDSDNNNIFMGPNLPNRFYGYFSANRLTKNDFVTASGGKDANSNTLDPMISDPSSGDLSFENFALDNLGTPVGITTDIIGETRSTTTPDIGAYETNPCKKPTALFADSIVTDAAKIHWTKPATSMGSFYVLSQNATTPTGLGTQTNSDSVVFTNLTPNTTYFYFVRNSCGGNFYSDWVMESFTTPPCTFTTATLNTTSPNAICDGEVAMLSAPLYQNAVYTWYHNGVEIPGAISYLYGAHQTGDYFVEISKAGCTATSDTLSFTTAPAPTYTVSANTLQTCAGQPITISVTGAAGTYSYQWRLNGINIPGATNNSLQTTSSGKYTVLVGTGSCVSLSKEIDINVFANPNPPIYTQGAPILMTDPGYTSYSWQLNGNFIPNSNGATYIANQDGTYRVRVVDQNGCIGISNEYNLTNSSITSTNDQQEFKLYPNPANSVINIEAPNAHSMTITNAMGQDVLTSSIKKQINIDQLANGNYNVSFFNKDGVLIKVISFAKNK